MQIDHEAEALRLEHEADQDSKLLNQMAPAKDRTLLAVIVLVSFTLIAAFCYFIVIGQGEIPSQAFSEDMSYKDRYELRALFGDQWGAFTGIMSGLSLAFVALSLFAQRSELRMSREEISMQRMELKYARAQSHRQINELIKQREDDERRGVFQKEPIVMVSSARLVPLDRGAEIHFVLDHFGAAACSLSIDAEFADTNAFPLQSPQILLSSTEVSHKLTETDVRNLNTLTGEKREIMLNLNLKYCNLAGGCFLCNQVFSISNFSLKSVLFHTGTDPCDFTQIKTTFQQGDVVRRV